MVMDTYKVVKFSGGASYGGTDDYVHVVDAASLHIDNTMTICWRGIISKNTDITSRYLTMFDKATTGAPWTGVLIDVVGVPPRVDVYVDSNIGVGPALSVTTNAVDFDVVTHYAIVIDSGVPRVYLYKNGVRIGDAAIVSLTQNVINLRWGCRASLLAQLFLGKMFEGQVYNRALTAEEVNYAYLHPNNPKRRGLVHSLVQTSIDKPAAGTWRDVSPQTGNNGTITNATTSKYPAISAGRNALFFPTAAASDRVNCGNGASLQIAGTISGEFWIRTKYTAQYQTLAAKIAGATGWEFDYWWSAGNKILYLWSNNGHAIDSVAIPDFIDGTWKHVVFTHTPGAATGEIYVNGVNKTATRTIRALTDSATNLLVGNLSAFTTAPVGGYFSAARLYNRILTAAEVKYNYAHPNNPIRRGLVLNLSQESLYGIRWYDLSGNANDGTITGAIAKNIADSLTGD